MALLTVALLTMALLTMALLTVALLTMALLTMALLTMALLTPGRVPLDGATHFCEAAGARLCTAQELSDNEATGSGCAYDLVRVRVRDS